MCGNYRQESASPPLYGSNPFQEGFFRSGLRLDETYAFVPAFQVLYTHSLPLSQPLISQFADAHQNYKPRLTKIWVEVVSRTQWHWR